ncbi:restriction endonuclease, partial [Halorussus sp. GCM10023401]
MDRSTFGEFVAALWEQQGWQTQVKRDGQKVFVAVQRPQTGEEGLLWAIPAGEDEIGGKQVQQFAKLGQQYEVEESAIVTAGTVSEHARKAASSTGVELLDGEGVATLVRQRGLEDLVRKFEGDATDGDGDSDAGASGDASPL